MEKLHSYRRGIYLLPTTFTVGNIFCGFASVVMASRGEIVPASVLIILAAILDGLDGRIARLTGTTSEFGVQFDSLADIVSFGVAPAFLMFSWALNPLERLGWVVAFLFVLCAAMRLARFNIQQPAQEKRFFAGLPSPMAASALAAAAFAFPEPPRAGLTSLLLAILVATVALLMIGRFRYRSFKDLDLRNRRSYIYVLPVAAAMVAVVIHPRYSLLLLTGLYLISAPAGYLWGLLRRLRQQPVLTPGRESDPEAIDDSGGR